MPDKRVLNWLNKKSFTVVLELNPRKKENQLFIRMDKEIKELFDRAKYNWQKIYLIIFSLRKSPTFYPDGRYQCGPSKRRSISDLIRICWGMGMKITPKQLMINLYYLKRIGAINYLLCPDINKYVFYISDYSYSNLNKVLNGESIAPEIITQGRFDYDIPIPIAGTTGVPFGMWGLLKNYKLKIKYLNEEHLILSSGYKI